VLAIFPLLGFLTGRLFCGWACPEGAFFEFSDFLTLKLLGRRSLYEKKPNDPDIKAGIIGVSIYMLITSIFVRHVLCRFICAAGLMQMLFGWVSPFSLRLNMDVARADECTNCKGCDRACFMNVTPRSNKRDISCVNCGACIAACNKELGPGRGLFHYRTGNGCVAPEKNCKSIKKASPQSSS